MRQKIQATILLVDDDPLVLDSAARLLQEEGLKVIACRDGFQALDRLREGSVDAVLSDIKMPAINGLDLLRKIRALDPEIPVLLMTGYADLETAVAAIQGGVFDFVLKPYNPPQLIHAIEKALSFKHLRQFEKNFQSELARRLAEAKQERQENYEQMVRREAFTNGQLFVANEAETIQTPINLILSNIGTLNEYIERMFAFIASQDQAIRISCQGSVRAGLEVRRHTLEMDFIGQHINILITESLEKAREIKTAIHDLAPISEPKAAKIQLD